MFSKRLNPERPCDSQVRNSVISGVQVLTLKRILSLKAELNVQGEECNTSCFCSYQTSLSFTLKIKRAGKYSHSSSGMSLFFQCWSGFSSQVVFLYHSSRFSLCSLVPPPPVCVCVLRVWPAHKSPDSSPHLRLIYQSASAQRPPALLSLSSRLFLLRWAVQTLLCFSSQLVNLSCLNRAPAAQKPSSLVPLPFHLYAQPDLHFPHNLQPVSASSLPPHHSLTPQFHPSKPFTFSQPCL